MPYPDKKSGGRFVMSDADIATSYGLEGGIVFYVKVPSGRTVRCREYQL